MPRASGKGNSSQTLILTALPIEAQSEPRDTCIMEQWETVSLNRTSSSASSVTSVSDSEPASPAEPNAEASSSRVEDAESRESSPSVSDTPESPSLDVTTPLATASDLKDEETTSVAKHPVYYFDDGNVCFLVRKLACVRNMSC